MNLHLDSKNCQFLLRLIVIMMMTDILRMIDDMYEIMEMGGFCDLCKTLLLLTISLPCQFNCLLCLCILVLVRSKSKLCQFNP